MNQEYTFDDWLDDLVRLIRQNTGRDFFYADDLPDLEYGLRYRDDIPVEEVYLEIQNEVKWK